MKQKRTFVTLLLIIALLCLGIAYAAITGVDLNITGNVAATIAEGTVDVKFTNVQTTAKPEGAVVTAEIDSTDTTGRTGKIDVSKLTTAGDTVTIVYTIQNQSTTIPATLGEATDLTVTYDNTEWFEVTCKLSGTSLAKNGENGDTQTATLTVKLKETVINDTDAAAAVDEISIHIDAEPVGNAN